MLKKSEVHKTNGDYPRSIFLRTLVKEDVLDRLNWFAKQYSNGMNKWDYGVAIQVLLDFWEYHYKQASVGEVNAKLDILLDNLPVVDEKVEAVKKIEMLGGKDIKV